jgi:pimeloyl-ACP methyl ester carboxylesterase
MNLEALHAHREHLAGTIHGDGFAGPALFIRGGQSDYLDDGHFEAAQTLFPRATLRTIAEAGHWVHVDAPGPFIATVRRFLASTEPV